MIYKLPGQVYYRLFILEKMETSGEKQQDVVDAKGMDVS